MVKLERNKDMEEKDEKRQPIIIETVLLFLISATLLSSRDTTVFLRFS